MSRRSRRRGVSSAADTIVLTDRLQHRHPSKPSLKGIEPRAINQAFNCKLRQNAAIHKWKRRNHSACDDATCQIFHVGQRRTKQIQPEFKSSPGCRFCQDPSRWAGAICRPCHECGAHCRSILYSRMQRNYAVFSRWCHGWNMCSRRIFWPSPLSDLCRTSWSCSFVRRASSTLFLCDVFFRRFHGNRRPTN